jgi:uridine kinase
MAREAAPTPERRELLERLAVAIGSIHADHVVRVAVDGMDAAGKTTMANELVPLIRRRGRPVIQVSGDGFHRPRAERYARGELSPEGYYRDAFDVEAIAEHVLKPLGPGVTQRYRTASFDLDRDRPTNDPVRLAPARAVLLMDGVFLLRPELIRFWEFAVFLDINDSEVLRRALARDGRGVGEEHLRERYERRYLPAHALYEAEVHPRREADVVIEDSDPEAPLVTRMSPRAHQLMNER